MESKRFTVYHDEWSKQEMECVWIGFPYGQYERKLDLKQFQQHVMHDTLHKVLSTKTNAIFISGLKDIDDLDFILILYGVGLIIKKPHTTWVIRPQIHVQIDRLTLDEINALKAKHGQLIRFVECDLPF
jgi:hypothetical protein